VDKILSKLGYIRGIYNPDLNKVESDRYTDIFNLVNTHQSLPYIKIIDDPFLKVDIIDVQFELTLQKKLKYDIDIETLLNNRIYVDVEGRLCYTLNEFDNFLLLCTHLYTEAILIEEIKKYKDLQLNKFADIYEWILKYHDYFDWGERIAYIENHGFIKPVLYCLHILSTLYDSSDIATIYNKFGDKDLSFIDEYRDELFNVRKWNTSVMERIFRLDKVKML